MNPSCFLLAAVVFVVPTHTIASFAARIRKAEPQTVAAYSTGPRWVARIR